MPKQQRRQGRRDERKRTAVKALLMRPEWRRWSDRAIQRALGLGSDRLPRTIRAELFPEERERPRLYRTRHGTEALMRLAGIRAARWRMAKATAEAPPEARDLARQQHQVRLEHFRTVGRMLSEARHLYAQTTGRRLRLDHAGDPSQLDGFEAVARTIAGRYPELLGVHGYRGDGDSTEAARRLFDRFVSGNPRPLLADLLEEATDSLSWRNAA